MSNGPPDENELFHPIQNLINLIWLAKLEPDNPEKVLRYLTLADAELLRLTEMTHRLFPPVTRVIGSKISYISRTESRRINARQLSQTP